MWMAKNNWNLGDNCSFGGLPPSSENIERPGAIYILIYRSYRCE